MYTRLSDDDIRGLHEKYFDDSLFCTVSEVFDELSAADNDLSAAEIWSEALLVMDRLKRSKRPDLLPARLRQELTKKYSAFLVNGHAVERSRVRAEDTCAKVFICVLYMICSTDDWKKKYARIAFRIGSMVAASPLLPVIFRQQRRAEEFEESAGNPLPEIDYLESGVNLSGGFEAHSESVTIAPDLMTCFADKTRAVEFVQLIRTDVAAFINSPEGNAQLWEVVRLVAIEEGYIAHRCSRARFAKLIECICPNSEPCSRIQANMEKYSKIGADLDNDMKCIRSRLVR